MGEQEMGKLLVYLKDYKKESVLGPLFKLLEASFELIVPLVMAAIIDHGVADGDKPYIMKICAACSDRIDVFYHGPVFCSKGSGRFFHRTAPRTF